MGEYFVSLCWCASVAPVGKAVGIAILKERRNMAKKSNVLTPFKATISAKPKGYGRVEYDFISGRARDEADANSRAYIQASRDYQGYSVKVIDLEMPPKTKGR